MERLEIVPLVRGALMDALNAPVFLLSTEKEDSALPELSLAGAGSAAMSADAFAQSIVQALGALKGPGGGVPPAFRLPGLGSFYAGLTWEDADAVRKGGPGSPGGQGGQRGPGNEGGPQSGASPEAEASRLPYILPQKAPGRHEVVKGRIALVTGGAQGFGAEIVRGLVEQGAFVYVADINMDGAQKFAGELNSSGRMAARALAVDVSSDESVRAMAEAVVSETGGLDLLISNAGVLRAGSVLSLPAKDFDFVTRINYNAFFLVVKHLAAVMVNQAKTAPRRTADIIQINSKSGLDGSNKNGAYAGSKFGGIGLVQSFAKELVEYGIKVNAVCPGNFFDGPLWSDPEKGLFVQYLNSGKVPGAQNIADVRAFYEEKVPMRRGCFGADVLKAILYCVEQEYETGQAVPVTGGQIMLN